MEVDPPAEEGSDVEFTEAWANLSKSAQKRILKQQARSSSHPRPPKSLKFALDATSAVRASSEPPSATGAPLLTPNPTPPRTPMQPARRLPLLICGIGNPGAAYANTLHSAGLTVVKALADKLGYPPFAKERAFGNGLVSRLPGQEHEHDWTLWQSTSYMNDSGKGVAAAFQHFVRQAPEGRLVVVYDELERQLGSVTVRTKEGASAKGHNGLKSVMAALGGRGFVRVGVGIGRPVSRESGDVAAFVLRKMSGEERGRVEGAVEEVVRRLEEVEKG